MVMVSACHKCREYVEAGETFDAQRVIRAFEQDHKYHPMGSADSEEVGSYVDVTDKYSSKYATQDSSDVEDVHARQFARESPRFETDDEASDVGAQDAGQGMSSDSRRVCPHCGSHEIKEVEDKTRILSYIPKIMYAKKLVCRKCAMEFGG